jgi:hypothetical protein
VIGFVVAAFFGGCLVGCLIMGVLVGHRCGPPDDGRRGLDSLEVPPPIPFRTPMDDPRLRDRPPADHDD